MPQNCCKYFTVSLVPITALTLAILFGCSVILLPVLYEELAKRVKVRESLCLSLCLSVYLFLSSVC